MILSAAQISAELSPRMAVECDDSEYVLPSLDYFESEFLPWFSKHVSTTGLRYAPNRFDCDDFAREFVRGLVISARHFAAEAGVCAAILRVTNTVPSLGIPAGRHALNLVGVATETGHQWLVVEPQNQLHVPLSLFDSATDLSASF